MTIDVLLIAACSRSGSTILGNVLGEYPGVFAAGELNNLWQRGAIENRACGCGEPFRTCPVWRAVVAEGFGELSADQAAAIRDHNDAIGTVDVAVRRLPGRGARLAADLDAYGAGLRRVLGGIDAAHGPALVVDSAKSAIHALVLSKMPDVKVRVLHLVRDVRGVAHSTRRHKPYDPGAGDGMEMERYRPLHVGAIWATYNVVFEREWGRGDNYRRVRYEDLMADPRRVVEDIVGWCGIPVEPSPFVADGQVRLGVNHNVSGNPSRFETGLVDLVADDEWRAALPRHHRASLAAAFAPLLVRYGYPLRTH